MPADALTTDDALADFARRDITLLEVVKTVLVAGTGPAVIVMAEMPGISPHVARFARWVRDAGFTVYMPSLFGRDGALPDADEGAAIFQRACMSAEFRAFAANESSPVTQWLRALARLAHRECGGPGVGAIGMCFTGNFALSMMLEQAVLAPVLSQPSLPLNDPGGLEIAPQELQIVAERMRREDLTVLAYRFEGDRFCVAANSEVPPFFARHVTTPHSVVTVHLIDEAGQPTIAARDEILSFFKARLGSSGSSAAAC